VHVNGQAIIEYRAWGGTAWTPALTVGMGPLGERIYGALGWTNVGAVRMRVERLMVQQELSAVEVWTLGQEPRSGATDAKWRWEYCTASDPTWIILCEEGDGAVFGWPKWGIDTGAFGNEIYASKLRLSLVAWGDTEGDKFAYLAEVRIYTGDVLWGKAVLGLTPPFNTAADKTLQAMIGWKDETLEVDVTATDQTIVDYRALQVLRERLRRASPVHMTDVRPDARLGQTVYLPAHLVDAYDLDYAYYQIQAWTYAGDTKAPRAEVLMLP
jgi:hypothetical protein